MKKTTSGLAPYGRVATPSGFTIVELLIVVVIIAVLAAISIVAYTGIQNRANDSAVQSDLKNIATKIEMYRAGQDVYPVTTSNLETLNLRVTKAAYNTSRGIFRTTTGYNLLYCRNTNSTQFALIAGSRSGSVFQFAEGSVRAYEGSIPNWTIELCNGAGVVDVPSPSGGIWLYHDSAWRTWVN